MIARLPDGRGRRMPPFAGTEAERDALALHLALLGGATPEQVRSVERGASGAQVFGDDCSMCHGPEADVPFQARDRKASVIYDMLGQLPELNDARPAFDGSDEARRALSEYLATLEYSRTGGGQ